MQNFPMMSSLSEAMCMLFHVEFHVAHICTLNFDIDEGDILSETPQFLKMETYDNSFEERPKLKSQWRLPN